MKNLTFILLIIFTVQISTAQNIQNEDPQQVPKPKFKLGFSYAYGPEVSLLLFPPVKVNMDYYFNKNRNLYIGLDGTTNVFIAIWGHIGFQTGIQIRSFYIESGLDLTFFDVGNYVSFNPKIGYDVPIYKNIINLYLEAGPSYQIRSDEKISELEYVEIGKTPLNLEIGLNTRF